VEFLIQKPRVRDRTRAVSPVTSIGMKPTVS
jgi:hypothetical protein